MTHQTQGKTHPHALLCIASAVLKDNDPLPHLPLREPTLIAAAHTGRAELIDVFARCCGRPLPWGGSSYAKFSDFESTDPGYLNVSADGDSAEAADFNCLSDKF